MSIVKAGQPIRTLDEWKRLAPPKSPGQWVDGRSAKEVARAWLEGDGVKLPKEVQLALAAHPMFGPVVTWEAEPEARLPFDNFPGETRNSDLAVFPQDAFGPYVLAVEAKADEPFGETVGTTLANALESRIENPRSNGIARIESLVSRLLRPHNGCAAKATDLRYQLLTACAGAVEEARRRVMARAVLLVHEFVTDATSDANHRRNATDLARFVARVADHPPESIVDGQLYGPFNLIGASGIMFFVGKVIRRIRPGVAEPGAAPSHGGEMRDGMANAPNASNKSTTVLPSVLQDIMDRIRVEPRSPQAKDTRVISSNVSSGFKKVTGGEDYTSCYKIDLRRAIAELGATSGVQVSLLVELAVLLKQQSPSIKRKIIRSLIAGPGDSA